MIHSRLFVSIFNNFIPSDLYDLALVQRIFKLGDNVRVRIKSRQRTHAKFASVLSVLHKEIEVNGVFVSSKNVGFSRVYLVHHNRLTNPLLI